MTTAAITTIVRSGVLDVLDSSGPLSTEDLAARAHVRSERLDLLLNALGECGVVERADDGRWTVIGSSRAWELLVPIQTLSLEHFLEGADAPAASRPSYASIAGLLSEITGVVARQFAPMVTARDCSLLELGAGDAPWSRALLAIEPTMTATVVDRPEVMDELGQRLDSFPGRDRLTMVAGDVFDVAFEERFDVVVLSALCRLLGERANEQLFGRVAGWLAPGGSVVVLDAVRDGTERPGLALYELSLAGRTNQGRVYDIAAFSYWMRNAGLDAPTIHDTAMGSHVVLRTSIRSTNQPPATNNQKAPKETS